MKQFILTFTLLVSLFGSLYAQVAVNSTGAEPDASAMLDVSSTDKGILVPRLTTAQRNAIVSPADGLMVYDTEINSFWFYDGGESEWVEVNSGVLNIDDLSDARTSVNSVYIGKGSGYTHPSSMCNTAVGISSLWGIASGGEKNTAFGYWSSTYTSTGVNNTSVGAWSLQNNETGSMNTAIGSAAGVGTSGNSFSGCVFLGYRAGFFNTSDNKLYIDNSDTDTPLIGGDFSTDQVDINGTIKITGGLPGAGKVLTSDADGLASWEENPGATELNDLGDAKTTLYSLFIGQGSGYSSSGHNFNTAVGVSSLWSLQEGGENNTAIGYASAIYNEGGDNNTAVGTRSLNRNISGSQNTAVGTNAGYGVEGNSFDGCVFLGFEAGKNNTDDNKLFIDNSDTDTPLIGGDFSTDQVDINGTIKITGGSPGAGKVLTSDADGLASWQMPETYASEIDDLTDARNVGGSLYMGLNAGSMDDESLKNNTVVGNESGRSNTTGSNNAFFGAKSGYQNLSGSCNSNFGKNSGYYNTTGEWNSFFGLDAGFYNNGSYNVALGAHSLYCNNTGNQNTVIGASAGNGVFGTNFSGCVIIGYEAGYYNYSDNKLIIENSNSDTPLIGGDFSTDHVDINGSVDINGTIKITGGSPGNGKVLTSNFSGLASWETPAEYASELNDLNDATYNGSDLFLGYGAGYNNGLNINSSVAIGKNALNANTTSDFNTAIGYFSLDISTGERNTAVGSHSLGANTSGDRNTSIGYSSGVNNSLGSYNTFIGYRTQVNNTIIKVNSTAIGNEAIITASDQVRIGNSSVTSIGGQVAWTTLSDGRFKENIKEDVAGLNFVLNLRPVSYEVNKTAFDEFVGSEYIDNKKSASQREVGFVAQEVEALIQSLGVEFNGVDAPEDGNDYYGIRYSQFVIPLVKSVQELNEKLEKENAALKAQNDEMLKRIEKLEKILLEN